jgi:hypothetical protein
VTLLAPIISEATDRNESISPWIATAVIIRNGEQSGSGVYLKSGLIITAAHLIDIDAKMSVQIAGTVLPAKLLKQGSLEDVDLSLLLVDEEKLPTNIGLFRMQASLARRSSHRCGCRACRAVSHRLAAGAPIYVAKQMMLPRPETQDPVFSIQIVNAYSAS